MGKLTYFLAVGMVSAIASAQAQSEPSARRAYLLCAMEDPACGPTLQTLYDEAISNPTWGGIRQICPPSRPSGQPARFGDGMAPMTINEIFHWYMTANADGAVSAEPGRIGMLYALRLVWGCRGPR
jgi:hypothetical protein